MIQTLTLWIIGFIGTLIWAIIDNYNQKGKYFGFDTPMQYFFSHPLVEIILGLFIFLLLWWLFLSLHILEVCKNRKAIRGE